VRFTRSANNDPTVIYKLRENIDNTRLGHYFKYTRLNRSGNLDWIGCVMDSPHSKETQTQVDVFKHVRIEGRGYQLAKK
jgi:hypothetical protein